MPVFANIPPWYQLLIGYDTVLSNLQRKSILFHMTMFVLGITKGIMEAASKNKREATLAITFGLFLLECSPFQC